MKKYYVLILLALVAGKEIIAQDVEGGSAAIIEETRNLYNLGRMDSIPKVLNGKLPTGDKKQDKANKAKFLDKNDQSEGLKLLTLSYIFLDQPEDADQAMLTLLQKDKLFRPNNETDPAELFNLYYTYRTWPIFRASIIYGSNVSIVEVLRNNSIYNYGDEDGAYGLEFGFLNFGLNVEKDFFKNLLTVGMDLKYGNVITKYDQQSIIDEQSVDGQPRVDRTGETEEQIFLGGNLMAQYHPLYKSYERRNFKPYVYLGASINYLTSATLATTNTTIDDGTPPSTDLELINIENTNGFNIRTQPNFYAIGGIGMRYHFGLIHLLVRAEYNFQLNENLTKNPYYAGYPTVSFNDVKVHYAQLTIGAGYSFYKPKKLVK